MASRLRRSILDNDSDDSKFDDDAIWLLAQFDASATADLLVRAPRFIQQ